jgi:hypothetical protein
MGTEREIEREEERLRTLKGGRAIADEVLRRLRVSEEPAPPDPFREALEGGPSLFSPEVTKRRQELGLPVGRAATIEELRAIGPRETLAPPAAAPGPPPPPEPPTPEEIRQRRVALGLPTDRNATLAELKAFGRRELGLTPFVPEPPPEPPPPLTEAQRRQLRQERGLPADRDATLEELKAFGRRELERDPTGQRGPGAAGFLNPLIAFQEGIVEPGAALLTEGFQRFALPGEQEIQRRTRERREAGEGFLGARTAAFRESDLPPGVKGAIEFAADPFNVFALGPLAGLGRRLATRGATQAATRAVPTKAAPAVTKTAERRFRLFRETNEELGEAILAAAEEGADSALLGPVRRLQIFDDENAEPLLAIAARRQPFGRNVFEVEVRGLSTSGKAVPFEDEALRGTFSRRELFQIADDVMNELKADSLIGFRLGREGSGVREITREQVNQVLGRSAAPKVARESGGAVAKPIRTQADAAVSPAPAEDVVPQAIPTELGENVIGLRPIEQGLTRGEEIANIARRTVGVGIEDSPIATPALAERARVQPIIATQANNIATTNKVRLNEVFVFDEKGRIPALAGVDPTVKGAPTIQDVAARLPRYADQLSPGQAGAMAALKADVGPYRALLDEVGVPVPFRSDVIEGGFYVPRGNAAKEGADAPVKVRAGERRGGKRGSEKTAVFDSQAAGIEAGFEYSPIEVSLSSYAKDSGTRATEAHVANFFKNVKDPVTGELLGETAAVRVPAGLRTRMTKLKAQIAQRRDTLKKRAARISNMAREQRRATRRALGAEGRAERAGARVGVREAAFSQADLNEARQTLTTAISETKDFAFRAGQNTERLSQARVRLNSTERSLRNRLDRLQRAAREAEEEMAAEMGTGAVSRPVTSGSLSKKVSAFRLTANRLSKEVDRLSGGAETMAEKVDNLIERGQILRDVGKAQRDEMVQSRRVERALVERDRSLGAAQRELRVLSQEQRRLERAAEASGVRAARGIAAAESTAKDIQAIQREISSVQGEWELALRRSRQIPRDQSIIALPGLQAHSFPDEIANAANKILRDEGPPRGANAVFQRVVGAFNNLYRGLRATADNSAPGIQGLLGLANDPAVFKSALSVNLRAWANEDVLGRYIIDFDDAAQSAGRLNSKEWGRLGVHTGGIETEFQLGAGAGGIGEAFGNLPVIRQANRAFGFFGDALRLGWADDLLQDELRRNRSLSEIISSGDAERIAGVANSMTGWSSKKFAGSWGELLLFAPRFLQSRLEVLTKAAMSARPGASLDQRIARRSLLRLVGGAVVLTYFLNAMQGQDTDFSPFRNGRYNSNFMRVRFGGRDWSLLGTWDSLARAIIVTAQGRPHEAVRGMGSGVVSMSWDLISGEDFIGRRVRDDAGDFAVWLMRSMTPFAAEEIPESVAHIARGVKHQDVGDVAAGAVTIAGEMFGAKSAPLSFTDVADQVAREMNFGSYKDSEDFQKNLIKDDEQTQAVSERRPGTPYFDRLSEIDTTYDRTVEFLAANIHTMVNGVWFDEERIGRRYSNIVRDTTRDRAAAARDFGIEFDEPDPNETDLNKRALNDWHALGEQAEIGPDGIGGFDYEKFNELRDDFLSRLPSDQRKYVLRNTNIRADIVPDFLLPYLFKGTADRIRASKKEREEFMRRHKAR